MMIDPGSASADVIKKMGFVTTKSKMCVGEMMKKGFES